MLTVTRKEGETIILIANEPETKESNGDTLITITIKIVRGSKQLSL